MAISIREQILAELAIRLNAQRNPYALDYQDEKLVGLYDEGETLVSDYSADTHTMSVRLTCIDRYDENSPRGTAANALMAWLSQSSVSSRTLGGLCDDIRIQQAAPAYSDDPSAFIGAVLELAITYRTAVDNPYMAAPC